MVLLSGLTWFILLGFMKNWKKRWFVLDFVAEYFAYFETDEVHYIIYLYIYIFIYLSIISFLLQHFHRKEAPKGVISLDQIKRVSLSSKRIHLMSNLFQVRTPLRTYNIKAPSIISMEIWMACLKLPPSSLVVPNPWYFITICRMTNWYIGMWLPHDLIVWEIDRNKLFIF